MALLTTYFEPLSQLSPNPQILHYKQFFSSKHTVPVIIDAHCAKKFLHNLGTGSSLPKQLSGPKLMGSGLGEHVKIWDPLFISATVEASNFKFRIQLGPGEQLTKKQLLGPKLAGVWARGVSKIICDPLFISATVEASNFKFGIQLGLGEQLPKKQLLGPKRARERRKNL